MKECTSKSTVIKNILIVRTEQVFLTNIHDKTIIVQICIFFSRFLGDTSSFMPPFLSTRVVHDTKKPQQNNKIEKKKWNEKFSRFETFGIRKRRKNDENKAYIKKEKK